MSKLLLKKRENAQRDYEKEIKATRRTAYQAFHSSSYYLAHQFSDEQKIDFLFSEKIAKLSDIRYDMERAEYLFAELSHFSMDSDHYDFILNSELERTFPFRLIVLPIEFSRNYDVSLSFNYSELLNEKLSTMLNVLLRKDELDGIKIYPQFAKLHLPELHLSSLSYKSQIEEYTLRCYQHEGDHPFLKKIDRILGNTLSLQEIISGLYEAVEEARREKV